MLGINEGTSYICGQDFPNRISTVKFLGIYLGTLKKKGTVCSTVGFGVVFFLNYAMYYKAIIAHSYLAYLLSLKFWIFITVRAPGTHNAFYRWIKIKIMMKVSNWHSLDGPRLNKCKSWKYFHAQELIWRGD